MRSSTSVALGLALLAVAGQAHAGGVRGLRAPAQRIAGFDPPSGWERAATPPSTRLLGTWAHRDGGRLTLAAERVPAGVTAQRLFDDSKAALGKQGWVLGKVEAQPMRVVAEATLDGGKRLARQLYLVEEGFAYVVTLVAPVEQRVERARDFDEAIGSLKLGTPDER
jgi:hypothetical protein